jgi:hypothetical protein
MSTLAIKTDERVKNVSFTEDTISVDLMDGQTIVVPLVLYPRLLNGTNEQLAIGKFAVVAMVFIGKILMRI